MAHTDVPSENAFNALDKSAPSESHVPSENPFHVPPENAINDPCESAPSEIHVPSETPLRVLPENAR